MNRLAVIPRVKDRFAPTLNGGQRGAQLMGNRGDKLVFHLVGIAEFLRHIIDRLAEVANFVIILLFQPGAEISMGNFAGGLSDLADRNHNRTDKVGTGKQHKEDDGDPGQHCHCDNGIDQSVHPGQGSDQPYRDERFVIDRSDAGNGDDPFTPKLALKAAHSVRGGKSRLKIGHLDLLIDRKARRGGGDVSIGVDRHQLHPVAQFKILHQIADFPLIINRGVLGILCKQGIDGIGL